jgi:gliding motility-associated lipoprotein GldH
LIKKKKRKKRKKREKTLLIKMKIYNSKSFNLILKQFIFNILIFLIISSFYACDKNSVYNENKTIEKGIWNNKNKIKFEINIKDTVSFNNVYINIRNAGAYSFSNLFLFVNTIFPDKKFARDTVECILADANGKWLGNGLGDIWDNQILFKKGVRFPMSGTYIIELEQAMRVENLPFIMDVGIKIEKISDNNNEKNK